MNRTKFILSACLILAITSATSLFAQPESDDIDQQNSPSQGFGFGLHRGWGHSHWGKMHKMRGPGGDSALHLLKMSDKLELSDQQEIDILEISQRFRKAMNEHRELAKPVFEKIRALKASETFDESALRKALEEAQPVMAEGMVLRAKYRSEIAQVLTGDQKQMLQKQRGKMKDRFGKKFKNKGRWGACAFGK